VLALVGLMAYAFTRPEKVDVPRVVGLELSKARERLDRAGFEKVKVEREQSFAAVDRVLRQDPDPGEAAERQKTVKLIVSGGPGKVRVPSVSNLPQKRAIKDLDKAGLTVTADPQPSTTVKPGFAIGTSPTDGTEVDRGSRVRLFVSSGPPRLTVPDVVGLTREAAETRLTRDGLEVDVQTEESEEADEGEVIAQSPASGTRIDRGGLVTITVATEPDQVSVPNVIGLSVGQAASALRSAGLGASVREQATESADEDGVVLEQAPGAGTEVDPGSSVALVVGRFEEPEKEAEVEPDEPEPKMPNQP